MNKGTFIVFIELKEAGNGSFIDGIKSISSHYIFYDLEPEHDEIIQQDYLICNEYNKKINEKIHVIGNPPFGRQSSIAIKFIKIITTVGSINF